MNARPEGRAFAAAGTCAHQHPAGRASHRKPPVALDQKMDLRKLDRLVFACRLGGQVVREFRLATGALTRSMIDLPVDHLTHGAGLALVPGLGAARPGLVAPFLAVCRRRLRRRPRRLLRSLKSQYQIDQFILRKPLQITAFHPLMDSAIRALSKGVGNYSLGHPPGGSFARGYFIRPPPDASSAACESKPI
jgi:hypothetical protein